MLKSTSSSSKSSSSSSSCTPPVQPSENAPRQWMSAAGHHSHLLQRGGRNKAPPPVMRPLQHASQSKVCNLSPSLSRPVPDSAHQTRLPFSARDKMLTLSPRVVAASSSSSSSSNSSSSSGTSARSWMAGPQLPSPPPPPPPPPLPPLPPPPPPNSSANGMGSTATRDVAGCQEPTLPQFRDRLDWLSWSGLDEFCPWAAATDRRCTDLTTPGAGRPEGQRREARLLTRAGSAMRPKAVGDAAWMEKAAIALGRAGISLCFLWKHLTGDGYQGRRVCVCV